MASVLLVYATTHGHTAKVARHLAEAVRSEGPEVELRDVADAKELQPVGNSGVIVGGSVHGGHHQRAIADWARSSPCDRGAALRFLLGVADGGGGHAGGPRGDPEMDRLGGAV